MKMLKKVIFGFLIAIGSLVLLIVIAGIGYKILFSQKKAVSYEINDISSNEHILFATQGSNFKKELVNKIIENYKNNNAYIKVIDVSLLNTITSSDWKSIIILNSIEANRLSDSVTRFISNNNTNKNIILIAVSGSGKWENNQTGIDAITTASSIKRVDEIKQKVLEKMN